jgi:hypothetical protein
MTAGISDMVPDRAIISAYLTILSGSAGRLLISLVYFLIVANRLTLAEFGLFATASATGMILSRLLAFGFVSPLYRVATVKPRLLGAYLAGFAALGLASLPNRSVDLRAIAPGRGRLDGGDAVFQDEVVGRLRKAQPGQPSPVHQGPGGAVMMLALPQQEAGQLLAHLTQGAYGRLTRPHQVADGLMRRVGSVSSRYSAGDGTHQAGAPTLH